MVNQADVIGGVFWGAFLKISRNPQVRFEWCVKNKVFQIKARSMVHTGGAGTFVSCSNFCFEVSPLIAQNFGKVTAPQEFLVLGGPAGGSAPGKVLRPQERIPYDS